MTVMQDSTQHLISQAELRHQARTRFLKARRSAVEYERDLVKVGHHVGQIIKGFTPNGIVNVNDLPLMKTALQRYSDLLEPWARAITVRMQALVSQKNIHAWQELSRSIGISLRRELDSAPIAPLMRKMREEQVQLIKSIPIDAAERVHTLSIDAMAMGSRAEEIKQAIMRSGKVSASKALTIGRTEIARTGSVLTEARARHIGSEGYFWRTSLDGDVRKEHKRLEGKFIRWDEPPIAGPDGERYHAGRGPNCRCYEEPAIPDPIIQAA